MLEGLDLGLLGICAFVVVAAFTLGWWCRGRDRHRSAVPGDMTPILFDDPEATLRIARRVPSAKRGGSHRAR